MKRLRWALLLLLLLWGLMWAVLPGVLKKQIEAAGSAALGRPFTVGAVRVRPWSLEFYLDRLELAAARGEGSQLKIASVYIDLELQSLLRLAPVLDALTIDGPELSLEHLRDGRYDIDDILAKLTQPSAQPASEPLRFALHNLSIQNGSVTYLDQPAQRQHRLEHLALTLPFLSNLDSKREIRVEPRLAFVLNGSRFDTAASATPFAQSQQADIRLKAERIDLTPYLAYWPASLPVRLHSGVLDADLRLVFEQAARPKVSLQGGLALSKARLDSRGELLSFERLQVQLEDVRPLDRVVRLKGVTLDQPQMRLQRDASGRLNLPATAASSSTGPTATAQSETGWQLALNELNIEGGRLDWHDEQTRPAAQLALKDITLQAQKIQWPLLQDQAVQAQGRLVLDQPAAQAPATLQWQAEARQGQTQVSAQLAEWPLASASAYLAGVLQPRLQGRLNVQAMARQAAGSDWTIELPQASLQQLELLDGKRAAISVDQIKLQQGQIDLAANQLRFAQVQIQQPRVELSRGADQRWMFERWPSAGKPATRVQATPAAAAKPGSAAATAAKAGPSGAWRWALDEFNIEGGALALRDASLAKPVALDVSQLNVLLRDVSSQGGAMARAELSGRIGMPPSGRSAAPAGSLRVQAQLGAAPWRAEGRVDLQRLPVQALGAYLSQQVALEILQAPSSFKGQFRFRDELKGPSWSIQGDARIEDFQAWSLASGESAAEPLLSWKTLALQALQLRQPAGQALQVDVGATTLDDFFARVIVNGNGRTNLQDLARSPKSEASTPGAPAAVVTEPAPAAQIRLGPTRLTRGQVAFSDRFIKPNYSASLTELDGQLGALSSVLNDGERGMADLTLSGRAEGSASLEVTGQLNPLISPPALNIQGKVRDLELSPLSPYAIKYSGHGIERGKLSMDIGYRIQPDGQLQASNQLVLNQLAFSEPVAGAPASLPVRLAVALLADRNGVIDVNLPISGSLNDPQFKLGSVIGRVILNLVTKAITSPVSLLTRAFGGGAEEPAMVEFAAGSSQLNAAARARLDKVAQALIERSSLQMTVVGSSQLERERDGAKRDRLAQWVLNEKRRAQPGATAVRPDEYPALLLDAYRRADVPKPRNLVGLAKNLPVAEMEAVLMKGMAVTAETMRELALQRGLAVRDYLAGRQVPMSRLFLGAAQINPGGADWSPRAELQLAIP